MSTIRKHYEHSIDLDDTPQADAPLDVVYVRTLSQMYTRNKCVHCGRGITDGRTCRDNGVHCPPHLMTAQERYKLKLKRGK